LNVSAPLTVVQEFFKRMEAADGTAPDLPAVDVAWTFPGSLFFSGTHVGRDAVTQDLLTASAPCFQPGHMRLEMHNLFASGEPVVAEYTGYNLTASGRPYENEYVFVLEVRDDLIQRIRSYCDTDYMARTLAG